MIFVLINVLIIVVGQTVRYRAPFGHVAAADYKVTQLLPAEDNELQYRIKRADEPHERVARESQLRRASN
jgi:hypothetical protein